MPQLTFNKESCPMQIKVGLAWNQVNETWHLGVLCFSQTGTIQEKWDTTLEPYFTLIELCMAIERCFEDWIQLTPAYAVAQLRKSISLMNPSEVPVGLQVVDHREPTGLPLGGPPTYPPRYGPPRRR
jgi:hypothetical protein